MQHTADMEQFIKITDAGGYFGRFFWNNDKAFDGMPGIVQWLPDNAYKTGWAGGLWLIRTMFDN